MKPGESSIELGAAWWCLAAVAVLVHLGERRMAKKLRDAEANCARAEDVRAAREDMAVERIEELHFELDGPWADEGLDIWAEEEEPSQLQERDGDRAATGRVSPASTDDGVTE
jgi:hypothetical protein